MITIYLDSNSKKPYYEQIYEYLRGEIRAGQLACGEKLPSGRKLALHLGVCRSTVDTAYAQLVAEGYIESKPKCGYFVSQIDELLNMIPISYPPVTAPPAPASDCRWDFSPTGADALNFPDTYWRKLSKECVNYDDGTLFRASEPQGDIGLRRELANYLRHNRGAAISPDNIVVGAGSQYLMMLLLNLIRKGSVIAMENPAYMQSYETFASLQRQVEPISVDEQGMVVSELAESRANVAYVTPSHQYPLGMVMPVSRRTQLLNWANKEPDRYIIEDDYDSEFRYQGKPIPALLSMDSGKKVVYMGSFSKVLSPAVRLSFMVLPDSLLYRYREVFKSFPSTVSRLDQAITTKLLNEGYFERHLNRLRNRYKARHDALITALKQAGDKVRLSGINAGSYVVLEWEGEMSEEELLESARREGIRLYPLSSYMITPCFHMYPTFLMGFAQMDTEELDEAIETLYGVWR